MTTLSPNSPQNNRERKFGEYEGGLGPEFEALLHRIDARESLAAERGIKAMMLAPNPGVCMALLRGERLPWPALRYAQLRRYGLKNLPADGRLSLDDVNDVRSPQ